jgi:hypothetical protein
MEQKPPSLKAALCAQLSSLSLRERVREREKRRKLLINSRLVESHWYGYCKKALPDSFSERL